MFDNTVQHNEAKKISYDRIQQTMATSSNARIRCQCGTVAFQASSPEPIAVYVCHCQECRRQSASAFGISAVFPAEGIYPIPDHLRPNIGVWTRPSDAGNTIQCYFCKVCGVRLFHRCVFPDGRARPTVNVKGGTIEDFTLEGATHIWTRSALVPVPEGSYPMEPDE